MLFSSCTCILFLLSMFGLLDASFHKILLSMVDGETKAMSWLDQHLNHPTNEDPFIINTTVPLLDITEEMNTLYTSHDADRDIDPYDEGPTVIGNATYLHLAAMRGFVKLTKRLISLGADVNANDAVLNGRLNLIHVTPAHLVALFGPEPATIVDTLFAAGADLSAETNRHITPIMIAIDNGNAAIFGRLLALMDLKAYLNGDKPGNKTRGVTLASETVDGVEKPVLEGVHREDLIPIRQARKEATHNWLHLAANQGNVEVVEALLDNPILRLDVNARGHGGRGDTALAAACHSGQLNVVRYLVSRYGGEGLRNPSQDGLTPWILARASGKLSLIRWIKDYAQSQGLDLDAVQPNPMREVPVGVTENEAPPIPGEIAESLKESTPSAFVTEEDSSGDIIDITNTDSDETFAANSADEAASSSSQSIPASTKDEL